MKVDIILANVEAGKVALPAFQRGYVWKRRQVRQFFDSLYRGHPVGSLLTWLTSRDDGSAMELLLDGQQRVTSLYGVIKGRAPDFFSGDASAFSGLHFHAIDERFEFLQPIKMKDDPNWFDVTKVMQAGPKGIAALMANKLADSDSELDAESQMRIMGHLLQLLGVTGVELHVEQIADEDKRIDTVVDIFNRLNSAGTTLSSGDLALARIAAKWPEVRDEMRHQVENWSEHRYHFTVDWLLRCVNSVVNGEAAFQYLHDTPGEDIRNGLHATVKFVDTLLNEISSKLGLDHDRVLFGRYSIPVLARHLTLRPPGLMSSDERNALLYWFLQAGMRGRYSGTTEAKIKQDLLVVDGTLDGIKNLIGDIGTKWGRHQVTASDFDAWSLGARLYPVLYWLTRVGGAKNLCDGTELKTSLLGKGAELEVHHLFPKAVLYDAGYAKPQVNALANLCFLTSACNKWIGAACPAEPTKYLKGKHDPDLYHAGRQGYFAFLEEKNPGVLESQWIPMDEELWKVENFPAFLEARRSLLAAAANRHLTGLYQGHGEVQEAIDRAVRVAVPSALPAHVSGADEEEILEDLQYWMSGRGLPSGEFGFELRDAVTEEAKATIDLAWPNGLPEGRGRPVALLLNESAETYRTVSQAGFDCHTSVEVFKHYIDSEIVGEAAIAVA